eukprot:COSAG02_NODE_18_length_54986_cov_345.599322_11_plen_62_part_00
MCTCPILPLFLQSDRGRRPTDTTPSISSSAYVTWPLRPAYSHAVHLPWGFHVLANGINAYR